MLNCYTILVGYRHFGVGSDLSAIASARELHPGVKPSKRRDVAANQPTPLGEYRADVGRTSATSTVSSMLHLSTAQAEIFDAAKQIPETCLLQTKNPRPFTTRFYRTTSLMSEMMEPFYCTSVRVFSQSVVSVIY